MKDLFERLKAESPVNKLIKGHRKSTEVPEKKRAGVLSPRRDSMPPPCSPIIFKAVKANKGRSLSPPKSRRLSLTKPFKVLIERKKLDQLLNNAVPMKNAPQKINVEIKKLSTPPASRTTRNNKEPKSSSTQQTVISPKKTSNLQSLESNSPMEVVFKEPKKISTPQKKSTSNKAQQKQCVTASTEKALQHPTPKQQQPKLKRCLVRVRRENLHKLQSSSTESRSVDNQIPVKSPNVSPKPKRNLKRKSSETPEKVSPRKRGRPSKIFIKLSTSKTELNDQGEKETKKNKKDTPRTPNKPNKINSPSTQVIESTKPTNLSRTNLIAAFGKRFFKSHVKIEKCTHPLMLIFESNARARKEQANHSKCKNLSVSFRDQVEIFGSSDEESGNDEDAYQSETSLFPTASFSGALNAKSGDISLPVMPARLKKIENGKVVDDIVLDPALFLNPEDVADCAAISSTPYPPGHKKREKILFSPLKGDATPSLRKEQFKLANEKIPASVLRHVNIDDMDDDDDDEDCEYIVPTEIPERRGSRTNSSNAADSSCSFVSAIDSPVGNSEIKSVTSEEVSTAPLKIDSEVTLANEVRDIKEQNNEASGVESELITRIQVSPSPTHSAHSSLSDGLSAKLKSITSPMTSPVSQSEIPGEASEIPGATSPTHNTLSALLGDVSPIPGALSPTDGTLSPAPGAKSPIDGAMSPTDGAMSPTDGAMSPTDGAMSPTDGALLATDGEFSAIDCMLPSTDNALTSTPGASSPTPGASSPTPGASSPTPGASSPTPGASCPTPGASSPTPAPSSPTPGASSPTPGALSPKPGTSSPTHEPQASSPVPGASSATTGVLSPDPGASSPAPETLPKLKTKTVTVCIDENSMDAEETTPKSSPKNNLDVPEEGSDVTEKSKPHCEPDIALDLFVDVDPEENVSKGLSLFPDSEEDQDILDCLLKERIDEIAKDDDVTNTSVGEAVADDSSKPDELEHILSSANTDIDAD